MMGRIFLILLALAGAAHAQTTAQDEARKRQETLQALPDEAAKKQFFLKQSAASLPAQSIGFYSKGCLSGAQPLPLTGPGWQVMRPSRQRNWGHPQLITFLQRFAAHVPKTTGWPGLLIGDLSQARGGPMLTGHASHQIGLDADIWLTPMPQRILTLEERDSMMAVDLVAQDRLDVDPRVYTSDHLTIIRLAASAPEVERVLVNAAIKKALCRHAGADRGWLQKVRPYWGHNYHFHVRMACPATDTSCRGQEPPPSGDGCGKDLDWWFSDEALHPKPSKTPPPPPLKVSDMPAACLQVLNAP